MLEQVLYGLIFLFLIIYFLRGILMVGYDYLKYRSKSEHATKMIGELFLKLISLKPLLQRKLEPKGYDFKLYQRFQNKFAVYYTALWLMLFLVLVLSAKVYLNAF